MPDKLSDPDISGPIEDLGFRLVARLSGSGKRRLFRVRRGKDDLVLKSFPVSPNGRMPYPIIAHRLLPHMRLSGARRLVLPEYVEDGAHPGLGPYVVMSFVEGKGYKSRWHYAKPGIAGGLALGSPDIDLAVELLADLSSIPVAPLLERGVRKQDSRGAYRLFERTAERAGEWSSRFGALRSEALTICSNWAEGHRCDTLHLSNEDFRFPNLIELSPSRTAVIDWDGASCSSFEIEKCVAYLWIMLWRRADLQRRLVDAARELLAVTRDDFRAALVSRAVGQAGICMHHEGWRSMHLEQAAEATDDAAFSSIWG